MEPVGNSASDMIGLGEWVQSWSRGPELTWCYDCNTPQDRGVLISEYVGTELVPELTQS